MANIRSQIKRNRQNERRRARNKGVRTELRSEARKTLEIARSGDADGAAASYRRTARLLDTAAAKGTIHKRTAARRKSRLARATARGTSS